MRGLGIALDLAVVALAGIGVVTVIYGAYWLITGVVL